MQCAECGREVGPGTVEFATRVLVRTKAGPRVVLCGSCSDPAKPFGRKWAILEDPGALPGLSTTVTPRTGLG